MLEPKEHYGKLHRQCHSPVRKTTTQSPVKVLKFIAFTFAPYWCFSPSGSVKNRLALVEIEDAERTGKLKPGHKIGNWSITCSGKSASKKLPIYPD
jgi:cysteine synthase